MYENHVFSTPLGLVHLSVSSFTHAFVESDSLVVNGVQCKFNLHLEFDLNAWKPVSNTLYTRRNDWMSQPSNKEGLSRTGCKKILDVIIPLVNDFMTKHPQIQQLAHQQDLRRKIDANVQERAELAEKIANLDKEHEKLLTELMTN